MTRARFVLPFLLLALAFPAAASAATGNLTFNDCITGNSADGPTGSGACSAIPAAAGVGASSGLNGAVSVAVTSDGKSLYAASSIDNAVARFDRNPSTGALTYVGCITGSSDGPGAANCTPIATASPGGGNSGLYNPEGIAVSPDGKSVYVIAQSDESVATFSRNTTTGALTYVSCLTGANTVDSHGSNACTGVPRGTSAGFRSGLLTLTSVTVSPDNKSVYTTAGDDDAIGVFSRNTSTGALGYLGCISGNTGTGATGTNACANLSTASATGAASGMDYPGSVTVAPDNSVYVLSQNDDAVYRFDRDTSTSLLTAQGCITGSTQATPTCTAIPSAQSGGADSGLDQQTTDKQTSIVASPDGKSLYAVSALDDAVARFDRNTTTGALTYEGCLTSETQSGPSGTGACSLTPHASSSAVSAELRAPLGVAVSPDGQQVYASTFYGTLDRFNRAADGSLSFEDCVTGNSNSGPSGNGACSAVATANAGALNTGIDRLDAVGVGPDSTSVYAISSTDDSVARFSIVPPVVTPPPSGGNPTPVPPAPKKKKKCKKAKKGAASAAKCKKKKK
jgi:fibronectin-binding autotransporter adhesin